MNPSPGVPETPPNISRRRIFIGAIALVILVAASLGARPAYRSFKSWRSQRLAAQAEQLLAQNDWERAQAKAQAALLLAPSGTAAIRAMALTLTRTTNVAAFQYWRLLINSRQASERDRQIFVEQSIRAGAAAIAAGELQLLLAESPKQPTNVWLASQLFALVGDRVQTVQYASQAALLDPTNRQYNLFASSLEFDAADAATRGSRRSNVWARAKENDPLAMEALEFLAQRHDLVPAEREQLIGLLRKHPLHDTTHDLMALGLELEGTPARRGELLDQAVTKYKSASPEIRTQFGVWLNQNREFERTLIALPIDEALKRKEFFLAHTDALASLGRWEELRKLFESPQTPLEAAYAKAFRARCESQLKNKSLADLYWRDALRAAERNPQQLSWLALYAEKCDEIETAKKTLRELIGCMESPRPAFRELIRLSESSGSTTELRDLLGEAVRRWPDDVTYQNDFAYLNLLLGEELASSCRTAELLVKEFPENFAFRTTFALALYRQKDFRAAMDVYAGHEPDPGGLTPAQGAVYAAIIAGDGRAEVARELAGRLDKGHLRLEERALVTKLH
jgi:hypothetical protein